MSERTPRLKKLLKLQEKLKSLHETRHAGHVAEALAAEAEAKDLVERFDAAGSLSSLFPELYQKRIAGALARRDESLDLARREAERVATATARTNMVERSYRDARRHDERQESDRERLEIIEQKRGRGDFS